MSTQQLLQKITGLEAENSNLTLRIDDQDAEIERLKKENERLQKEVEKRTFSEPSQAPFVKAADAKKCVDSFRNANELSIPHSILFLSSNIGYLAQEHPYVRFYMGTKKDGKELTLIAVGVHANNEDEDDEIPLGGGATTTTMYEFADPCPKCNIGQNIEQVESLLYDKDLPCRYVFQKTAVNECGEKKAA